MPSAAIRFRIFENPDSASAQVASEIALLIRERAALGRPAVLGLATGRTPVPLYEELIYLHREEGLSLANVVTFNLDEYLGLDATHPASFRTFMQRHLFDHVDIPPWNIHFLRGDVGQTEVPAHCRDYEEEISAAGGIDYQILGIGRNGHIGFNEPGTASDSLTSRVTLHETTRRDAAEEFGGLARVPVGALTMGCGTILGAGRIALMAWGAKKAGIVRKAILGPITPDVPASYLQSHPTAQAFLDPAAASSITREPPSRHSRSGRAKKDPSSENDGPD